MSNQDLPQRLLPFAIAGFFCPLLLGPLFDTVGRKPIVTAMYGIADLLRLATPFPFGTGKLRQRGMGILFSAIFLWRLTRRVRCL